MIIKSYEVKKKSNLINNNFFLLYGENLGLKKDIRNFITSEIKQKDNNIEIVNLYESEIINNEENFFSLAYTGSLFGSKKIITIYEATDKLQKRINDIYDKYPDNIFFIIFSEILDTKSKLRTFFEKNEKTICIPCYLDSEKDLEFIAQSDLLVGKANSDRNNLRNEIEKIKCYAINKKNIEIEEIRNLINFSGDYKSDILVNECLCGNISEYKKIISELYISTINQILLLRILGNKIHRLLKIKEQENISNNLDNIINNSKPKIFWKEKPLVKKQLLIWNLDDLKKIINDINDTEILCKKNPKISNSIFFNFFSEICKKANSYS